MANFLDKIFGSKIEVDLMKVELEAKLCFQESRMDGALSRRVASQADAALHHAYGLYLHRVACMHDNQEVLVSEELSLLQDYVHYYQRVAGDALFLRFDSKVECDRPIPAFLLFPLVTNALQQGYNAMEKFPLKIKVRSVARALQLEVVNHVNHHIASQEQSSLLDHYKSRLLTLYSDQHTLLFNSNSHTFKANLHIPWPA